MSAGAGLGRTFDIAITDGVSYNMAGGSTIAFVAAGGATLTVQRATSAAGAGAVNHAVITTYYTKAADDGSGVWTKVEQAAAATIVAPAGGQAICEIEATSLPTGFNYLRATVSAGEPIALLQNLNNQAAPERLRAMNY